METLPNDLTGYEMYLTLGRAVAPRPVGWISTTSKTGDDNVAPYSFATPIAVDPPVIVFQAAPHEDGTIKDTARNVIETGDFVYNVVTRDLVDAMNESARHVDEPEFDTAEITREPATTVAAPRVAESPVALECRLREIVDIEETKVIFGDVELVSIDDDFLVDGLLDVDRLESELIGHVIDEEYTTLDCFRKPQPQ
ncbi:MAG: flavin reductase family protein [Halodesulfurarchaeum sp.]